MLDGAATWGAGAQLAGRIAAATGCRLLTPCFVGRLERGAGAVPMARIPYNPDLAAAALADLTAIVICGTGRPTNFFGYPGKASTPEPPGCALLDLCPPEMDVVATLTLLAKATGATGPAPVQTAGLPSPPPPAALLSAETIGAVLAARLPFGAVVIDEAITNAAPVAAATTGAAAHDWLCLMGGAIGNGLPLALGVAVACPDRPVVALMGDGSAMYTLQALWTMARERLNVVTLIFANRGYQILRGELENVGVTSVGRNAARMFDVEDPSLDWVALAQGHGVAGERVTTAAGLDAALTRAFAAPGPGLIEMVMP